MSEFNKNLATPQPPGTVDLNQGQSYTTPNGATIKWAGDTISICDSGNNQNNMSVSYILGSITINLRKKIL